MFLAPYLSLTRCAKNKKTRGCRRVQLELEKKKLWISVVSCIFDLEWAEKGEWGRWERERGERVRVRKGEIAEKNFYVTQKQWRKNTTISVFFLLNAFIFDSSMKKKFDLSLFNFCLKVLKGLQHILSLWHFPTEKINFSICDQEPDFSPSSCKFSSKL